MAHQVSHLIGNSEVGLAGKSRGIGAGAAFGELVWHPLMSLLAILLVLTPSLSGRAQTTTTSPYVPSVVVSSISVVPVPVLPTAMSGTEQGQQVNLIQPTYVTVDACGNVYTIDTGGDSNSGGPDFITQIPANGGPAIIVENIGSYHDVDLGQDPTYKNLLQNVDYGTGANQIPLTNCVPNATLQTHTGGGNGALFYYYNPAYVVGDFSGDTYISTAGVCCVSGSYYLVQEQGSTANILLSNTAKQLGPLAVDMNQNVYLVTNGALFELPYSGGSSGTYSAAPIPFGGAYSDPVGLTVDAQSNLYIVDQGAATVYEIPFETSSSGVGALNPSDQFTVATGVSSNKPVAISPRGDLFFTQPSASYINKISLGNANFGLVAIGQTAPLTVNFQFNAAVTPASVQLPTGVFATQSGGRGFPQCTAGTAYGPGGSNTICEVDVTFTPTAVGKQSSSVVLEDASGNAIATAYLEGVGQGPLITLDPGTTQPTGSGLKSPTGIAVDQLANAYIADPSTNSVTEYPAGGGAGVPLSVSVVTPACGLTAATSALPLAAPTGVAVDGAGNVYIADTGNNRVVKVPFIKGALSVSSASLIGSCTNGASTFSSPASVFVQTNGDVYVTDTGNNRILWYPALGTNYGAPVEIGSGLSAPLTMTADATGDVYIANSGAGTIVEFPAGGGQELVDAGILQPSGMTTDASGALFVVDQGNFRVLRIPSTNGVLSTNNAAEVALGVANPYGIALDSSGNLYVTDSKDSAAYVINRTDVALPFGELAVGSTSDPLPLTVESAGTLPVIFTTPYDTVTGNAGDFAVTSPTGACAGAITLAPGSSCDLAATFTPTASGARAATLTFNSNSATAAEALLSGTGMSLASSTTALAFTFAPGPNAPFYGEPLSFAATVTGTSPTGFVSFVIDGVQAALEPLVSGVATLPLNSGLTGGSHSIYALYKGDSANDGSSSAILPITIAKAPTTPTIAVTIVPFNNPYSLRHSNPGSCAFLDTFNIATSFAPLSTDSISFLATVSSPGVGIPTGTLTWYSDGHLINGPITTANPNPATSVSTLLPAPGGIFTGPISSDGDTLGDGTALGENNTLVGPHNITVVYSGDQNYLTSTSTGTQVIVVDVGPTTPIMLTDQPVGAAPYCTADQPSGITVSRPADPSSFVVQASSPTVTSTPTAPGTVTLTFFSLGGYGAGYYPAVVDITCPNLPQYTTCSANPGQASIQPSTPGVVVPPSQVVLTFTTNVPPYVPTASQSRLYWLPSIVLGFALLYGRRRIRQWKGNLVMFGVAMVLFGGMLGFSGCGSGTSSSSGTTTKPGSYAVTVVLQGSQFDNNETQINTPTGQSNNSNFQEFFRPDVPYTLNLTLNVK